ncbi:MAG: N-acyl-D-amino-acid deacylase family protein [Candidatus Binataceae bacterium]
MQYDLLVRGGTVVDGTGTPGFHSDLAINAGRIAAIIAASDAPAAAASREIDATGSVVAPGFIDLHSHSDWIVPIPEHAAILKPFLLQGVTTFVGGNCGFSTAPVTLGRTSMLDESGRMLSERQFEWRWQEVAEFGAHLRRQGLALNVAHLAGHGSIRLSVMGASAAEPSAEELHVMRAMVERAMADGAVGLSTGLGYFPGMIAKPAELAALAEVAARAGAILTSHLRAYSVRSLFFQSDLPHNLLAVREMVDVARRARARLQISHLIFVGRRTWDTVDEVLREIERAQQDGVDVAFDTFPYTGGNTTIRVIYPAWSQTGLQQLLESSDGWARLRDSFRPLSPFIRESAQLLWAVKPELREFEGKLFGEIADAMHLDPVEAYLTITRESGTRARVMLHLYSGDESDEHALRAAMVHPLNAFEMDTILTSRGHHNPASFGTYPRVLGHYVRELGLLSLEDAVHKFTGLPAARMRLADRGLIRAGYAADLTIFNPATVDSRADFRRPDAVPVGIEHVLVNGRAMIANGTWCGDGVMPGQWLTRA